MLDKNFSIKIFKSFDDPVLKKAWLHLEKENDVYAQMHFDWIEPWWKRKRKSTSLYIVTALQKGNIVGIAPFSIRNSYGVKILESIPKHFGDFYYFLVETNYKELFHKKMIQHCLTFDCWDVIQFNQINDDTLLYKESINIPFVNLAKTSDIVYTTTEYDNFEGFLNSIPKKQTNEYKRRLKRLNELGNVEFITIETQSDYDRYDLEMQDIYIKRWGRREYEDRKLVFEYRRESFGNSLNKGKALGFILKLDGKPIAYRMGFLYKDTFVSTRLVYDLEYAKYSLGNLISIMTVKDMIERGIKAINNGVGDYNYKSSWFNNKVCNSNYSIYLFKKYSLHALIYKYIQLKIKPSIKRAIKRVKNAK